MPRSKTSMLRFARCCNRSVGADSRVCPSFHEEGATQPTCRGRLPCLPVMHKTCLPVMYKTCLPAMHKTAGEAQMQIFGQTRGSAPTCGSRYHLLLSPYPKKGREPRKQRVGADSRVCPSCTKRVCPPCTKPQARYRCKYSGRHGGLPLHAAACQKNEVVPPFLPFRRI